MIKHREDHADHTYDVPADVTPLPAPDQVEFHQRCPDCMHPGWWHRRGTWTTCTGGCTCAHLCVPGRPLWAILADAVEATALIRAGVR